MTGVTLPIGGNGSKALEATVAQDGLLLTERQLAALEPEKESHGEFESEVSRLLRRPTS